MNKYRIVLDKIGIKLTYLYSGINELVIKIEPKQEYWLAKTKEGEKFKIHRCSELARITLLEATEISEEDYNAFELIDLSPKVG